MSTTRRRERHGLHGTPEYVAWVHMIQRCTNPGNEKFPDYGARGVTVCGEWRESFLSFYADMGPRPSERHSLDRRDNDGNYEPDNCRWATDAEQANNRRPAKPRPRKGCSAASPEKTRLLKCACPTCGYTLRTTRRWLKFGAPICPTDQISMTESAP